MTSLIRISFCLALACSLQAQSIERISQSESGLGANGASLKPSISSDARYVAFESLASNLIAGDANEFSDIFVHDRLTGLIICVSMNSIGEMSNGHSHRPVLSADGNYISFMSYANNLVPGDDNGASDVFVYDLIAQEIFCVSKSSTGVLGNSSSRYPSISADGRYVAFDSFASNLVSGDRGYDFDVFVHDIVLGKTSRVSLTSSGREGNYSSIEPSISGDGRFVAFTSFADNLVLGDINLISDTFVRDRLNGLTFRVSEDPNGLGGNGASTSPHLSGDGLQLVYVSDASNLTDGDRNHKSDIFLYSLITEMTSRVSVDSDGVEGNSDCANPVISHDGRIIAFESLSDNLALIDLNDRADIFMHDWATGQTRRLSVDSDGVEGNLASRAPSITERGRVVVFESDSVNFFDGDSNEEFDIFATGPTYNPDANKVLLTGPFRSSTDEYTDLNWEDAPPNSFYWLVVSENLAQTEMGGFVFDLGPPAIAINSGRNTIEGTGSFSLIPLPGSLAGLTLYFEVVCRLGPRNFFESNPLAVKLY